MKTTEKTLTEPMQSNASSENPGSEQSNERFAELRERLSTAMESAKLAAQRLEEKTVAAAKATDQCIREHPYQTIGITFGLGLLVGVLLGRRRN